MIAKREVWAYNERTDIWIGKYLNSQNLPHWHSDCELLFVEEGSLNVVCENKSYDLKRGDAFFIDSEQVHYMRAKENGTVLIVIIFNFSVIKDILSDRSLACPKTNVSYDVKTLYGKLKKELSEKKPFYCEMAKAEIFGFFINVVRNEKTEKRKEKNVSGRLKTLIQKINDEYETITFREAYEFMAMDESYFCRYFKKATGRSFTRYLNHIKVDNAIRLMRQKDFTSVTNVSVCCGFGSIRHFNKTFKEITGYSPSSLPDDFALTKYAFHTDNEFNPTLPECSLIEGF